MYLYRMCDFLALMRYAGQYVDDTYSVYQDTKEGMLNSFAMQLFYTFKVGIPTHQQTFLRDISVGTIPTLRIYISKSDEYDNDQINDDEFIHFVKNNYIWVEFVRLIEHAFGGLTLNNIECDDFSFTISLRYI